MEKKKKKFNVRNLRFFFFFSPYSIRTKPFSFEPRIQANCWNEVKHVGVNNDLVELLQRKVDETTRYNPNSKVGAVNLRSRNATSLFRGPDILNSPPWILTRNQEARTRRKNQQKRRRSEKVEEESLPRFRLDPRYRSIRNWNIQFVANGRMSKNFASIP